MVEQLKQQINNINWFSNVGGDFDLALSMPISRVENWASATKLASGRNWENIQLNTRGDFTAWLSRKHHNMYQGVWNNHVKRHKSETTERLAEKVWKPLFEGRGLNEDLIHSIKWDVMGALMETTYAKELKHPFNFSRQLIQVYAAGHFPCGWKGDYPGGNLIIF